MRWVVEFVAAVLTTVVVFLYYAGVLVLEYRRAPASIWVVAVWMAVCAGAIAGIGFASAFITHHFPWRTILLVTVGAVGFFLSLPGISVSLQRILEALGLPACAALALAIGALFANVWRHAKGGESA